MKSKKLLLGSLSAMALVATPIAAVVSCDNKKPVEAAGDKKAAPKATITETDTKGFQLFLDSKESFYISEELAKTAGSLKAMIDGKVVDVYTWAKPIELGKDPELKLHRGIVSSKIPVTIKQAVAKQFVVKPALWPKGAGMVISENTSKDWFDGRLTTRGTNGNILGIKLPTSKNTTNVSKVTEAGIKEFNNFVKPLGWVAKMITATTTPEVPAKALSATEVTAVHGRIDSAKSEQLLLMTLTQYTDGSGNPIDTSTVKNATGADAATKLAAQKTAAKALITTATQEKAIPAKMTFVVSWDSTPAEDRAKYQKDVDKIATLFTQKTSPAIPVVATKAKAKLPHATIAAINTFVGAGFITTPATLDPLKMVDVTFEMEVTVASTATTNGEAVLTITKGKDDRQVTATVTFVITHP